MTEDSLDLKGATIDASTAELVELAVSRGEGQLSSSGALVTRTFERTGRSPKDKFIVRDPETESNVWWGPNQEVAPEVFERVWKRAEQHLATKPLFVNDAFACADEKHRIGVRLITELAWHALFSRQLFRRPTHEDLTNFHPDWTILGAPELELDPSQDGTSSEVFVGIDFSGKRVLVVGTHYAGEIKKSIFSVLNYLLPLDGVFSMHCSANVGRKDDVALFFGLSGTGKTTLSADPNRKLIGDDEHGWSDDGVFNFEGGCYAKCVNLSKDKEPQIYAALKFGAVIENVVIDPNTRVPDFDDTSITENTRAAYPLDHIPGAIPEGIAGHAGVVIFLTADAFGVLPPVSVLTPEQAEYHFLSGFTSKLAGTEAGLGDEPEATFSTCFGAPFLPLHPTVYSKALSSKIKKHSAQVFLVNTGWSGGPFGVGQRFDLDVTRAIISAALSGDLEEAPTKEDPVFGLHVPTQIDGVPSELLVPRDTWNDPAAYDAKAKQLAERFVDNFEKFADDVDEAVLRAGPKV